MRKKITPLVLCFALILMTSCATILSGSKQKVTFKSNMPGTVYQNLKEIGKTNEPIKINKIDIRKLYTIKADGCKDYQLELPIKNNLVVLLNILNLNIFGGLDAANGSNMKTDEVINVTMDCNGKK